MTILAKLVASKTDSQDYTTYVFKCLDSFITQYTNYIMCTRYPNWNHRDLRIGEVGYLEFQEHLAGVDKWFDGTEMVRYSYNGIQFIKFIEYQEIPDDNNEIYI